MEFCDGDALVVTLGGDPLHAGRATWRSRTLTRANSAVRTPAGGRQGRTGADVLVVDDDERVRTMVRWQLEADGHEVTEAADGLAALDHLRTDSPSMVVLDLSMPALGGLDLLRAIRRGDVRGSEDLPVIVLSGRCAEGDRILGLNLGADDYLVKPFSPGELGARVRSVLRRAGTLVTATILVAGPLEIDLTARTVRRGDRDVALTALEFDLLVFLANNRGQVFSRAQLLRRVWKADPTYLSDATVTEHVFRLRAKVEDNPSRPRLLRTRRGAGYLLDVP